ncbi:Lar family restriction alleviation protein [Pseudomonas monteilii]|uniref:Lar family restriction alleviation protein n=1 Tax=Pseudomonas monteilii TaxID=76759 RepID=UPI001E3885D7|nr:Lar family restriction alleviation protein [Pseudomonas monteilii]MCE0875938.1 Lar family restriction alleviation protein [Pseudomonas monteilii]MCE0930689.1 Lar family restriction alleviation protein [Pseudomonas monteilii]MCE0977299.1 Lar family restriction alleviation protein [Pseudomonas monteilii]MCE1010866.1 Lar family restriction alleviation protein [Pseudomonas monteilii]MCE1034367.1 Lar family restriction alleviation protein [Pseudomonas monteilii]
MPVEIIVRPTLGSYTARAKGLKGTASRSEGPRQAAEALIRKLDLGAGQLLEQATADLPQGQQRFHFVVEKELPDSDLLPCPFCGGKADSHCTAGPYPDWFVQCTECLASAHVFSEDKLDGWNNRALPAEQHKGEPVAVMYADGSVLTKADCGHAFDICCKVETPLYRHADSNVRCNTVTDERAEFEAAYAKEFSEARGQEFTANDISSMRDSAGGYGHRSYLNGQWKGWQARAALERKPSAERDSAEEKQP